MGLVDILDDLPFTLPMSYPKDMISDLVYT